MSKRERNRQYDAKRRAQKPWRAWYKDPRWAHPVHGRRAKQLRAHPHCERCWSRGRAVKATVANHREPHRGDAHKFWHGELESVCKRCHDGEVQREEVRGYVAGCDVAGRPLDPAHPWNHP